MPPWVANAVTIVQALIVGEAVAALTYLAARGAIDGGAAVAAILASIGVSGGAGIAAQAVARRNGSSDSQREKDDTARVG